MRREPKKAEGRIVLAWAPGSTEGSPGHLEALLPREVPLLVLADQDLPRGRPVITAPLQHHCIAWYAMALC